MEGLSSQKVCDKVKESNSSGMRLEIDWRNSIILEIPKRNHRKKSTFKKRNTFLGVIIYESLNWSRHIKKVQSKMADYVWIMHKIKKYLPLKSYIIVLPSHMFITAH